MDLTEQSPQHWHIIVPRLRQIYDFSADCHRRFRTPSDLLFTPSNNWDAWSKLVRPPRFAQCHSAQHYPTPHLIATASIIETIPPEILGLIIAPSALSKSDVVAFGLASPVFWPHVVHHIARACKDSTAPWAGAEIANVGNYLIDLPLAFEKDSLLASSVGPVGTFGFMCTARRLNYAAWRAYEPVGLSQQAQWKAAFDCQDGAIAKQLKAHFSAAISTIPQVTLTEAWALRNLTTKEYIRCRFDIDTQRAFVETELLRVSVEDVLLLRSCWTLNDKAYYLIERGSWAGHVFDIVLAGEEIPAMKQEGWKDITEDVVEDAGQRQRSLEDRVDDGKDVNYQLVRQGPKGRSFIKG